ncbi:WXG100 family type VII secretion target [Streptomyces sp. NPDC059740]|uniref:WXG100 family type VII secretion target n=1 Tax=Streptomyces sp. NPDC059740 TaxID=3346926 RepID=UPI003669D611
MSRGTQVDPAELRASARACDGIADDLKGPCDKAVKGADTAGDSLNGWSVGPALRELSASWKPALEGLHARLEAGGDNLRSSADGHEWNDQRTSQDFEKTGTGTATQSAFIKMPGSLANSGPPLSSGAPYVSSNLPTYGAVPDQRPSPGGTVFG